MKVVIGIAVLLSISALIEAQQGVSGRSGDEDSLVDRRSALIQGIRKGDFASIRATEDGSDKSYIPYLKEVLTNTRIKDNQYAHPKHEARVALAHLGEVEQQQELWCEFGQPAGAIGPLAFDLVRAGGLYGIRGLQAFLSPEIRQSIERARNAWFKRNPPSDVA